MKPSDEYVVELDVIGQETTAPQPKHDVRTNAPTEEMPRVGEPQHKTSHELASPKMRAEAAIHVRAARLGDVVAERYRLEALLSEGGMGRVYRARHIELGRMFAVKLVLEGLTSDLTLRERFFVEARLASSLSHRNIISVTDFGLDDELGYFLVMELLSGETLREKTSRARVPLRFACDVIDQVAGAVRYMHGANVVHCDLKPENVFLTRLEGERRQNHVTLLDFGLSWHEHGGTDARLAGTPPYIAPERLLGAAPSPVCDVYAMGVMLYEMVAGKMPYTGTPNEIMTAQMKGEMPPAPSVSAVEKSEERVDALVMRALAPRPEHRHASAEAFHYELRTVMHMMGMRQRRAPTSQLVIDERGERVAPPAATVEAAAAAVARYDSGLALDQLAHVQASPIPLAVFLPGGKLRFANRAFRELGDTPVGDGEATFAGLRLVTLNPELEGALAEVVRTGKRVWRLTLAGRVGHEEPMLLVLAPVLVKEQVESVHATLVATR